MAISNKKGKVKTIADYTAEGNEFYAPSKEQALADSNTLYDGQVKSTNEGYDTQVFEQGRAYENQYRENAVQKEINKRQVAESMANLGLRDSGLNRTQQTAVQLSYGNNKAAIDRQKQSSIDSLEFSRRQTLDSIEQNRTVANANIEQTYNDRALQYGLDRQSQDQAAYQNIVTGRIANGETPTDYEIGMSGWTPNYVKSLKAINDGAATREDYRTVVSSCIESGKMPTDDEIKKAGMNKKVVKRLVALVNTATTEAENKDLIDTAIELGLEVPDEVIAKSGYSKNYVYSKLALSKGATDKQTYQTMAIGYWEMGENAPDDVLSKTGWSKSEIKQYKSYYKTANSKATTSGKKGSGGDNKPKEYKLTTTEVKNIKEIFKDNGADENAYKSVIDYLNLIGKAPSKEDKETIKKVLGYKGTDMTDFEDNKKENGGSYRNEVLEYLRNAKKEGKTNSEINAYLKDLLDNNFISQSEYMSLYNKYRDNKLS